jgi:hypothetical protein
VLDPLQKRHVREAVEEAVRRAGGTGQALANALRISQPSVSSWMSGKSVPELHSRETLAQFLGWREYEILHGRDAIAEGGFHALEIALDYHGQDNWPQAAVGKARREVERGVRRTPPEWAAWLDALGTD